MAVNKVEYGDNTLIDLTEDTVDEEKVLEGVSFHNAAGEKKEGILSILASSVNEEQFNIDENKQLNLSDSIINKMLNLDDEGKIEYENVKNSPDVITMSNVDVTWEEDSTYNDFSYKGTIIIDDVTADYMPTVIFSLQDATSGNYANVCESGEGEVYIYSKINTLNKIPSISCIKGV